MDDARAPSGIKSSAAWGFCPRREPFGGSEKPLGNKSFSHNNKILAQRENLGYYPIKRGIQTELCLPV